MAKSRRVEKVAALIRKEMSELLLNAVRDQRVQMSMITVTDVEVAGDLQHCKIFVSIYEEAKLRDEIFSSLQSASGFLKGELARRLNMRRTPEVIFKLDKSMEKGNSVLNLLGQLEEKRKKQPKQLPEVEE